MLKKRFLQVAMYLMATLSVVFGLLLAWLALKVGVHIVWHWLPVECALITLYLAAQTARLAHQVEELTATKR